MIPIPVRCRILSHLSQFGRFLCKGRAGYSAGEYAQEEQSPCAPRDMLEKHLHSTNRLHDFTSSARSSRMETLLRIAPQARWSPAMRAAHGRMPHPRYQFKQTPTTLFTNRRKINEPAGPMVSKRKPICIATAKEWVKKNAWEMRQNLLKSINFARSKKS